MPAPPTAALPAQPPSLGGQRGERGQEAQEARLSPGLPPVWEARLPENKEAVSLSLALRSRRSPGSYPTRYSLEKERGAGTCGWKGSLELPVFSQGQPGGGRVPL